MVRHLVPEPARVDSPAAGSLRWTHANAARELGEQVETRPARVGGTRRGAGRDRPRARRRSAGHGRGRRSHTHGRVSKDAFSHRHAGRSRPDRARARQHRSSRRATCASCRPAARGRVQRSDATPLGGRDRDARSPSASSSRRAHTSNTTRRTRSRLGSPLALGGCAPLPRPARGCGGRSRGRVRGVRERARRAAGSAWPLERARTLLSLGTVRRRAQQKRAAREALEQALAIFEELGRPVVGGEGPCGASADQRP